MMENHCLNCLFYLPVDVFTGICKISGMNQGPDDAFCEKAERAKKCGYCSRYTPDGDFTGQCNGTVMTYPGLSAAQCPDFEWSRLN